MEVLRSGPFGTVSCGFQVCFVGVGFLELSRGVCLLSLTQARESSRSEGVPGASLVGFGVRGVGGQLRLNSFGTVIFVGRFARPALPRSVAFKAFRQLTWFRLIKSRTSRRFSSTCSRSSSLLLKCFCDIVRRESCESLELPLMCEYTLADATECS